MSYGLLFVPAEERIKPNLAEVYHDIIEKSIRDQIIPPDPYLQKTSRNLGRLFNTSTDDPDVLARARFGSKSFDTTNSNNNGDASDSPVRRKMLSVKKHGKHLLSASATIHAVNRAEGGKFHVQRTTAPYETRLFSKPSASAFNANTPKMWPQEQQYPSSSSKSHHASASLKLPGIHAVGKKSQRKLQSTGQGSISSQDSQPCPSQPSDSLATRSIQQNGPLSELQNTLSQCGVLTLVDANQQHHQRQQQQQQQRALQKAVQRQHENLAKHVNWLKEGFHQKESWHHSSDEQGSIQGQDQGQGQGEELLPSSSYSVNTQSTLSQSVADSWIQLNAQPSHSHSHSSSHLSSHHMDHTASYLSDLNIYSSANSLNPFRHAHSHAHSSTIRYNRAIPRHARAQDSTHYKDNLLVKTISRFNACIQPSLDIHHVPSMKEITDTLFELTRKQILCYHQRIIEVGALIKGIRDSKHATPGLQAIFTMHHAFVASAVLNTNPFILSRKQLHAVISEQLPWVAQDTISRLLAAFDNTNTGYIRYVRVSCTLLAAFEPAMANLAVALDKGSVKTWNQLAGLTLKQQHGHAHGHDIEADTAPLYSEAELKDLKGELLVLRFLHRLYGECNGHFEITPNKKQPLVQANTQEAYMQLNDLQELFSCCSNSPEDEQCIAISMQPLLQKLFDDSNQLSHHGDGAARMPVSQLLKHDGVRMAVGTVQVSAEQLQQALLMQPAFFKEFVRQVRAFRKAAGPYVINVSRAVSDSINHFASSRDHSTISNHQYS